MNAVKYLMIGGALLMQAACSGSSGGSTDVTLSGTVSAPSGLVVQMQPVTIKSMLAQALFGRQSGAATSSWPNVGAGVAVKLIQVDSSGSQVGATLASTSTISGGSYTLTVPDGFSPGPAFVVRVGSSTTLDARVTNTGTLDVDPTTDATSKLVNTVTTNLNKMSVDEILVILELVQDAVADVVDPTATSISADLKAEILSDSDTANVVYSAVTSGQICGNVKNSSSTNLADITVIARDYGDTVTRAKAKTDSNGNYCINVPASGDIDGFTGNPVSGEYILGAINSTTASLAASQWWTASSATATDGSGGANMQAEAAKVIVPGTSSVTKDFYLKANGARIQGSVAAWNGGSTQGVRVLVRDYDTFQTLTSTRAKEDGSFCLNVKPSDYMLTFLSVSKNPSKAYASEAWSDSDPGGAGTSTGVRNRNLASREVVTAGNTYNYAVSLEAGKLISGTVTDNATSTVVPGTRVEFNNSVLGRIATRRTNAAGQFRLWVVPDAFYLIRTYGHTIFGVDNTSADVNLNINYPSNTLKGKVVAQDGSTGVARAVMQLIYNDGSGNIGPRLDQVPSNEDGTFTLRAGTYYSYSTSTVVWDATQAATATFQLLARMDDNTSYGSGLLATNMSPPGFIAINAGDVNLDLIDLGSGDIDDTATPYKVTTLGWDSGVGYLVMQGESGDSIHIGAGAGLDLGVANNRMIGAHTRGDGTFKVTLPAGNYTVRSGTGGTDWSTCDISISNGATTTVTAITAGTCTTP